MDELDLLVLHVPNNYQPPSLIFKMRLLIHMQKEV